MSVVVDASVIIALVVADENQGTVRGRVQGWLDAGDDLHAPALLPFEIANVLARLVFDGVLDLSEVSDIWDDVAALGIALHPFDLTRDGAAVAAIAAGLRRRHATDATYVALARRLETTVWTLDGALARNAADNGLPVALIR